MVVRGTRLGRNGTGGARGGRTRTRRAGESASNDRITRRVSPPVSPALARGGDGVGGHRRSSAEEGRRHDSGGSGSRECPGEGALRWHDPPIRRKRARATQKLKDETSLSPENETRRKTIITFSAACHFRTRNTVLDILRSVLAASVSPARTALSTASPLLPGEMVRCRNDSPPTAAAQPHPNDRKNGALSEWKEPRCGFHQNRQGREPDQLRLLASSGSQHSTPCSPGIRSRVNTGSRPCFSWVT